MKGTLKTEPLFDFSFVAWLDHFFQTVIFLPSLLNLLNNKVLPETSRLCPLSILHLPFLPCKTKHYYLAYVMIQGLIYLCLYHILHITVSSSLSFVNLLTKAHNESPNRIHTTTNMIHCMEQRQRFRYRCGLHYNTPSPLENVRVPFERKKKKTMKWGFFIPHFYLQNV